MLLSCRSPFVLRVAICYAAVGTVWVAPALAVDGYFIPQVQLEAEHHSNIDINDSSVEDSSIYGYTALASGIFGLRTQRNVTELRPRIQFSDYPDRREYRRTNSYLDLNSRYHSLRSDWSINASYRRQDTLDAERTEAQYDDFDPNDPSIDTPARNSLLTQTRTFIQVRPTYVYRFSERVGTEFSAYYQTVKLDSEAQTSNVDYDYVLATGSLLWELSPRTQLGTGVYGSKYQSDNDDVINAKGVKLDVRHNWTQTFSGHVSVDVERADLEYRNSSLNETKDGWGLEFGLVKSAQISQIRLTGGRSFTPSTSGARTTVDQLRIQYTRNLTQRFDMLVAARGYRTRFQGSVASDDDRDYLTGDVELNWNVTRTWYVGGGYSYINRKYLAGDENGTDHQFTLGIGYRGLRPQAR